MLVYTFRLERVKQNIEVYAVIFELQVHVDNHEFKRVYEYWTLLYTTIRHNIRLKQSSISSSGLF